MPRNVEPGSHGRYQRLARTNTPAVLAAVAKKRARGPAMGCCLCGVAFRPPAVELTPRPAIQPSIVVFASLLVRVTPPSPQGWTWARPCQRTCLEITVARATLGTSTQNGRTVRPPLALRCQCRAGTRLPKLPMTLNQTLAMITVIVVGTVAVQVALEARLVA